MAQPIIKTGFLLKKSKDLVLSTLIMEHMRKHRKGIFSEGHVVSLLVMESMCSTFQG